MTASKAIYKITTITLVLSLGFLNTAWALRPVATQQATGLEELKRALSATSAQTPIFATGLEQKLTAGVAKLQVQATLQELFPEDKNSTSVRALYQLLSPSERRLFAYIIAYARKYDLGKPTLGEGSRTKAVSVSSGTILKTMARIRGKMKHYPLLSNNNRFGFIKKYPVEISIRSTRWVRADEVKFVQKVVEALDLDPELLQLGQSGAKTLGLYSAVESALLSIADEKGNGNVAEVVVSRQEILERVQADGFPEPSPKSVKARLNFWRQSGRTVSEWQFVPFEKETNGRGQYYLRRFESGTLSERTGLEEVLERASYQFAVVRDTVQGMEGGFLVVDGQPTYFLSNDDQIFSVIEPSLDDPQLQQLADEQFGNFLLTLSQTVQEITMRFPPKQAVQASRPGRLISVDPQVNVVLEYTEGVVRITVNGWEAYEIDRTDALKVIPLGDQEASPQTDIGMAWLMATAPLFLNDSIRPLMVQTDSKEVFHRLPSELREQTGGLEEIPSEFLDYEKQLVERLDRDLGVRVDLKENGIINQVTYRNGRQAYSLETIALADSINLPIRSEISPRVLLGYNSESILLFEIKAGLLVQFSAENGKDLRVLSPGQEVIDDRHRMKAEYDRLLLLIGRAGGITHFELSHPIHSGKISQLGLPETDEQGTAVLELANNHGSIKVVLMRRGWVMTHIPAAGLEEQLSRVREALVKAGQSEQVLVVQASVLSNRTGLEAFLAWMPKDMGRVVLFGSTAGLEKIANRPNILAVASENPVDLAVALTGLEEADQIKLLGDPAIALTLAKMLPSSMEVTAIDPTAGLEATLREMGFSRPLLEEINATGLEELFSRQRSA